MKKTLIILMLISATLFGKSLSYKEFLQNVHIDTIKKSKLVKMYEKETGFKKEQINSDIRIAWGNKHFKKAIYELFFHKEKFKIDYGKLKYAVMPNYKLILEELKKAVHETRNPFAAWLGIDILVNNYMTTGPNEIARFYMRDFAKVLKDKRACLGYFYYGRSFFKEFSKAPNYKKAYDILSEGQRKCIAQDKIPTYIIHGIKLYKVKAYTMNRLTKGL